MRQIDKALVTTVTVAAPGAVLEGHPGESGTGSQTDIVGYQVEAWEAVYDQQQHEERERREHPVPVKALPAAPPKLPPPVHPGPPPPQVTWF